MSTLSEPASASIFDDLTASQAEAARQDGAIAAHDR